MGAFGQYTEINPEIISFNDSEWKALLDKSRSDRDGQGDSAGSRRFGQLAARFLGIPRDEDEYYNDLFELSQKSNVHILSGRLNKEIKSEMFQAVQNILQVHQEEQLSINRFIAFMEGRRLLPSYEDRAWHNHIRKCFREVLEWFAELEGGLNHPDFRRVIMDLTKWTWNHLEGLIAAMDGGTVPCLVWYGDAKKSEQYFLYFILALGIDLLVFHPEKEDVMKRFDPGHTRMTVQEFTQKKEPRPFPVQRPVRKATVAYQASKEIDRILHTEETPLFKPWHYRSHIPRSVTLKTTYDELILMSREKAFIRPGFRIEGEDVYIPSLFAKIAGVPENRRNYWDRVEELKDEELSLFIKNFPFTSTVKANHQYHYNHALGQDGRLDPEKMIKSVWWQLDRLPTGVQLAVASAISRVCFNPKLLPEGSETIEDVRHYLFTQLTVLPKSIAALLMKFDYPQQVPRLILYNSGAAGGITRSDAALLLLVNELGMDIFLFNPSGLRDLELFIDEQYYDIHLLEQFEFNYEYQEPKIPVWRRLFKRD